MIVLLHGFMGTTLAHFGRAIKIWYGKVSLTGIDLPGHGRSPVDSMQKYYSGAIEYAAEKLKKNAEPVNLVGASYLGGVIALRIACQYPELVKRLVITGFACDIPRLSFLCWADNFQILAEKNVSLVQEYEKLHGSRWKDTMKHVIADIHRSYEEFIHTTIDKLSSIPCETLFLNGDFKDNEVKTIEKIKVFNPRLSGVIIPGAGHIVSHDKPIEFCQVIGDFLEI